MRALFLLLGGCELFANVPTGTLGDLPPDMAVDDMMIDDGCELDADCATTSGVCLSDRTCAVEATVRYVSPTAGATTCTKTDPCDLDTGIAGLGGTINVIQLQSGTYARAMGTTITPAQPAIFNGPSDAIIQMPNGEIGFTASTGMPIEIHRIGFDIPQGLVISCSANSPIKVANVTATNMFAAVFVNQCDATIERSNFTGNSFYGLRVFAGSVTIRNSFITKNGQAGMQFHGGLLLDSAVGGVIEMTTIADNLGMASTGIGPCVAGGPVIRNSIIKNNSIDPICVVSDSVIDAGYTGTGTNNDATSDPQFLVPGSDYHLMPSSPVAGHATPASMVDRDFDGQRRPVGGGPDPGADEI